MLQVDIEKIIPVTEARDMFNKIVDEVEGTDELYVLTKNGKPCAVVVGVNHLEKLTGESHLGIQAQTSAQEDNAVYPDSATNEIATDDTSSNATNTPQDFFSSNDNSNSALASEEAAVIEPNILNNSELAEPQTSLDANSQNFLTEENSSVPTAENTTAISEPLATPQSYDQIQPVPDDFSASIPPANAELPEQLSGSTASNNPIGMITPDVNTVNNNAISNENSGADIDPFSSSSTIAENPEEDGLPPNNQNSQV